MNLILLDLYGGGHHGQYARTLVDHWHRAHLPGRLDLVVSEAFVQQHPDAVAAARASPGSAVHQVAPFARPRTLVGWDRRHGREALYWGKRLGADHLLFLYGDHAQISLATTLRSGPTRYSAIHFRPSFHYGALGAPAGTVKERLLRLQKRLLSRAMLTNPRLHTLFELDAFAVPALQAMGRPEAIVALPEAFLAPEASGERPNLLQRVEAGRRTAAFFGVLDARKGLAVTLEALEKLPAAAQARLCVVLAGRMHPEERAGYLARIAAVQRATKVQVLLEERFLEEAEIQPLLGHVDLVLMPYVRHVGSSGVLIRAAHARRPVLTSDYGLVGALTRRHGLGLTADTTRPEALAAALEGWLERPEDVPYDPEAAGRFAAANTSEAFASTIFDRLYGRGLHASGPPAPRVVA